MRKSVFTAACAAALVSCANNQQTTIVVENNSSNNRSEIVAVSADALSAALGGAKSFVITSACGDTVPYQTTSDGSVIFMASVGGASSSVYNVACGASAPAATVATGRIYPERVDDIAWENDRIAFRAYGPALQASGEKAFGYDVWVKSCPEPVVEARYAMELDPATLAAIDSLKTANPDSAKVLRAATSYHVDHGNGLDCYKVGPTLGGGAAALLDGENIVYPYCYTKCEILDNGPLRFAARLTYGETVIGTDTLVETRTIVLEAGSQLNKTIVEFAGMKGEHTVVAGPVLHHADGGQNAANAELGYVAYADPTDNTENGNGTIYVGAVVPGAFDAKAVMFSEEETAMRGANGHMLAYAKMQPNQPMVYYWGAGWSKYGFDSFEAWEEYMKTFAANVANPLTVTIK